MRRRDCYAVLLVLAFPSFTDSQNAASAPAGSKASSAQTAGATTNNSQYRVILATNASANLTPLSADFGSASSGAIGGLGGLLQQSAGGGLSLFSSDFSGNGSDNSTNSTGPPVATLNRTFAGENTGLQVFDVNTLQGLNASDLCAQLQNISNGLQVCEADTQVHTDVTAPASAASSTSSAASPSGGNATSATPNDALLAQQWALQHIGVASAWSAGFMGSTAVRVCMIDTGVDYKHPDIVGNLWTNPAEANGKPGVDDDSDGIVDDIYGASFVNGAVSGDPMDQNGHGSFVAGIVGAVGNNKIGVTGLNQRAQIITCRFMDATGNGWVSDAVQCIDYCISKDAHIMSNSWGGVAPSDALTQAIVSAQTHGTLFVASAGNDGLNTDTNQHLPSTIDNPIILSVGATDSYDNFWAQSNYGTKTVNMAAPGVSVLSLGLGGLYVKLSGTSMATPHVAGAAALLLQKYAKNGWPITTTSNQGLGVQLKNLIIQSADPIPGNKVSAGKLNVFQALQLVPLNPNAAGSAEPFGSSASSGSFGSVESFGAAEPVFEPAPPEEGASNVARIEANSTSPSPGGFGAASAGTAPQLPPIYIRAPPAVAAPAPAPAVPEVAAQLAEAAPAMPRRAGPAAAPSLSG